MKCSSSVAIVGLLFAFSASPLHPQQTAANEERPTTPISLDVVVTDGSRKIAAGLAKDSFKVLDNGVEQPLMSFNEFATSQNPVSVLIVVDAVNTPFTAVAYQRGEIAKYLRANEGKLEHTTTFGILTDAGIRIFGKPSKDGAALAGELDQAEIGLREIRRDQGFYGAQDRLTISLNALHEIAAFERKLPGRKLVAWVSPGWPLLSGVDVQLEAKQQQQIYNEAAEFSTQLREAGITLDSVNSWGVEESLGRAFYYREFVKGVSRPDQTQLGNLGLQVLAEQSGGLVLNSSDVVASLRESVADADHYYELSFQPKPTDKHEEYHRLQVVMKGMKARTRQGYYTP